MNKILPPPWACCLGGPGPSSAWCPAPWLCCSAPGWSPATQTWSQRSPQQSTVIATFKIMFMFKEKSSGDTLILNCRICYFQETGSKFKKLPIASVRKPATRFADIFEKSRCFFYLHTKGSHMVWNANFFQEQKGYKWGRADFFSLYITKDPLTWVQTASVLSVSLVVRARSSVE